MEINQILPYTLVSVGTLEHLDIAIKDVIRQNIPGDFCEAGVWKGGVCMWARYLFDKYNKQDKTIFVADSFEGCPVPTLKQDEGDTHFESNYLKVPFEEVRENFYKNNLLHNVTFIRGWFRESLKKEFTDKLEMDKLCILRIDADMYEGTMDALENLYPKLSVGGYCFIDDYLWHGGCKKAVDEFREKYGITAPLERVEIHSQNEVHYWIK